MSAATSFFSRDNMDGMICSFKKRTRDGIGTVINCAVAHKRFEQEFAQLKMEL